VVLERLEPVQTATDDRFVVGAREDGSGYAPNWRLTAYALCADPLSGYGILPSTSGSPSSNSPQNTIPFLDRPTRGRLRGGASTAPPDRFTRPTCYAPPTGTVDFTSIAGQEDANGFAGAWPVTAYTVCASIPPNLTSHCPRRAR
jgi:hypothetical protein